MTCPFGQREKRRATRRVSQRDGRDRRRERRTVEPDIPSGLDEHLRHARRARADDIGCLNAAPGTSTASAAVAIRFVRP